MLFLSFSLAPISPIAHADEVTTTQAMEFIEDLASQALDQLQNDSLSLEDREAEFRYILQDGFEMEFISLLVLGNYRRKATAEEIEEYQSYFSEFILRKYTTILGGYAGEEFVVTGSHRSGTRDVIVTSEIRQGRRAAPIRTDWRVRNFDDEPKVIDVKVEGISMAQSQREEFSVILKRQGMTGLISMLRARVEMLPIELPA